MRFFSPPAAAGLVSLALLVACSGPEGEALQVSADATTYDGVVEARTHDLADGTAEHQYFLRVAPERWLRLDVDQLPLSERALVIADRPLRVRGELDGHWLTPFELEPLEPAAIPGELRQALDRTTVQRDVITGQNRVAVLLIGFQGTPNTYDPSGMRDGVFGSGRSASMFYNEGSKGDVTLIGIQSMSGDVFGPYTVSDSGCPNGDYDAVASQGRQQAQSDGVDVAAYDYVVHYFPSGSDCPGGGIGGGRYAWIFGIGVSSAWDYVSHEVGHCFGLPHASSSIDCTSGTDVVTMGGACSHDEYGDPTDVMGRRNFQFASFHHERLGWVKPENVLLLDESARVSLAPIEIPSNGVQSLRVARGTGGSNESQFHFEYRQKTGFDQNLEDTLTNGVLVRLTGDPTGRPGNPHLLDMTPGSRSGQNDFIDATLQPGKSFQDGSMLATVVSVSPEAAVIDITLDGVPPDPTATGGTPGTGGTASGGAAGASGSGGASTTGGAATGGSQNPTGGTSGGTPATGGSGPSTGGNTGGTAPSTGGMGAVSGGTTSVGTGGTTGGSTTAGGGTPPVTGGAVGTAVGGGAGGPASAAQPSNVDAGCGCRILPASRAPGASALSLLLLGMLAGRRRRRGVHEQRGCHERQG